MGFFDSPMVTGVVKQTLDRVLALEDREAKKLLARFREIRQELRDRLDFLAAQDREETFTAQQARGVLIQVDAAIAAINESLKNEIDAIAEKIAIEGAEDAISEIQRFEKEFTGAVVAINIDAALIGLDQKNFLINRYDASLDAYSAGLRGEITRQISNLSIQQVPFDTLVRRLSTFFIGEEWKLRRIARTELHNIYNAAKVESLKRSKEVAIPDLKKTLFHPKDPRTGNDSLAMSGTPNTEFVVEAGKQVVNIEKPFRFVLIRTNADGSKRKIVREFMAPPDRPNDRSILVPFRDEWDK